MLTGGSPKSAGFEMQIPRPLDYKTYALSLAALLATPVKFEGMCLYVVKNATDALASGKPYRLKPLLDCGLNPNSATDKANWGSVIAHWNASDATGNGNGWTPIMAVV